MRLEQGQKLFEFEIIRSLGEGGFATVFEATDKLLGRRVAIKQLHLDKIANKKAVKRFLQEARIAAAMEHPNVVSIYGLRHLKEEFFLIMEYLPTGTLKRYLEKQGKLPIEEAVHLTLGICEGLSKFHNIGIIHRDLKAENILLTADGRPKIIDFGIAHVPQSLGGLQLTEVGFQPSTLLYSSPEQVLGETLDPRSDVYQIGELLYAMLLGKHYIDLDELERNFLAKEQTQKAPSKLAAIMFYKYELLEKAICEQMPVGLKTLWREVGALAGVVEKAMAKNKNHRFKDAAEFAASLKSLNINTTPASSETNILAVQDSRAYNKRGLAYASTRNYEQAIIDYMKAIELDPYYAEAYNNLSTAHLLMENYTQAIECCTKALDLAPDFVATYVNRGIAYTGLRKYKQALENYTYALQLDPENIYAHYNQGNTFIWIGQSTEAIPHYTKAIELHPSFVAAYVNRGLVYTQLGRYEEALADFNQAIALNPDYSYAYYNRANLYREQGENQKAVADYSKVIDLNPQHRHAYDNRGDAYAAQGQDEAAAEDYTQVVSQTSTINPKQFKVAHSMLMPTTPLSFLTRK